MKKIVTITSIVLALSCTQVYAAKNGKTLEEFLQLQQKKAAEKGVEYTEQMNKNKTKLFAKMDADNNGKVTNAEIKAYVASKKK